MKFLTKSLVNIGSNKEAILSTSIGFLLDPSLFLETGEEERGRLTPVGGPSSSLSSELLDVLFGEGERRGGRRRGREGLVGGLSE